MLLIRLADFPMGGPEQGEPLSSLPVASMIYGFIGFLILFRGPPDLLHWL